jgi:hypothetical protein
MGPDAIAQIYASDIVSGFDIHKPEKLNVLFSRYGDQGASFFQLLRSMGFEKPVANDTYGHYEENHIHVTIHNKTAAAAAAAGATALLTLDPQDLDANNNFYVRKGDVIMFTNEVMARVNSIDKTTTPTAPVLTVQPVSSADAIPAVTAGEEIAIVTSAFPEGGGQPDAALSGTWEYDNDAQIIKETIGYTGTEMVNQDWFDVTSKGQSIPAYYFKGQIEIDYRMALKIDGALLWGRRGDGSITETVDGRTVPVKFTEGFIPYARRVGNEQTYTSGSFDIDEFDTMDMTLDKNFAGNYILGLLGIKLHQDIENSLKTYFANTNIVFAKQAVNDVLFNRNDALSASVNFTYLTKSERTFLFKRMGILNHPQLAGATGYTANELGLFMPINKRKDPVSGNMVDSIGTRYRALGKYSRRMEVWKVGGAGEGLKVTEFDKVNTYQRCHVGSHFRGGNQFVILEAS